MMSHPYVYVFIRKDISFEQQLVQAAHATLELGQRFAENKDQCSIVMIGVKNKNELLKVAEKLKVNDIDYELFFEPDFEMGESALATRPIVGEERFLFKKYNLYKSKCITVGGK